MKEGWTNFCEQFGKWTLSLNGWQMLIAWTHSGQSTGKCCNGDRERTVWIDVGRRSKGNQFRRRSVEIASVVFVVADQPDSTLIGERLLFVLSCWTWSCVRGGGVIAVSAINDSAGSDIGRHREEIQFRRRRSETRRRTGSARMRLDRWTPREIKLLAG